MNDGVSIRIDVGRLTDVGSYVLACRGQHIQAVIEPTELLSIDQGVAEPEPMSLGQDTCFVMTLAVAPLAEALRPARARSGLELPSAPGTP